MTDFESRLSRARSCHCLAARKRARALTRHYDDALRPHGLRSTQFSVLAVLGIRGRTLQGELAEILDLDRSTLSRNADVLERNGWIERAVPTDQRERLVGLTEPGRSALEAALPAWEEAQARVDEETESASDAG